MIEPPATIGVLGGGQLGRYAVISARLAGYRTVVLDPDPSAPAAAVADEHLVAAYDDSTAVEHLAATCAVVTTEFENPPADTLTRLAVDTAVSPSPLAVAIAQDRLAEKRFVTELGLATAPYTPVQAATDAPTVDFPGILKTSRLGYDGKGQRAVATADDLVRAWHDLGGVPCVFEQVVPLDVEVSVIVARVGDGAEAVFPAIENHHVDGILDLSVVPSRVDDDMATAAKELALCIARALDYVGVLAVELFVSDGRLLVNELAPRPHNSGHWTLDAAVVSQFDQQVRAICGAALGAPDMTTPAAAMVNLLGDLWADGEPDWSVVLADPSARLHLYGKAEPRPGRKMGHLTVLEGSAGAAAERAVAMRSRLSAGRRLG